jgi:hypothetical protein
MIPPDLLTLPLSIREREKSFLGEHDTFGSSGQRFEGNPFHDLLNGPLTTFDEL